MAYTPFVFVGTAPQSLWPHFSNCLCGFVRLSHVVKNADFLAQPLVSGEWQNMLVFFFFFNSSSLGDSNMPWRLWNPAAKFLAFIYHFPSTNFCPRWHKINTHSRKQGPWISPEPLSSWEYLPCSHPSSTRLRPFF